MDNITSLTGLDQVNPFVQAAISIVIGIIVLILVRLVAQRLLRWVRAKDEAAMERRDQMITLIQVIQWAVVALVTVAVSLTVLSAFIDIGPLLTSAGLMGLVITMTAQSLFKDVIAGAQILLENIYVVDDLVTIGDCTGTVERVTLRITYIREFGGDLVAIPNGDVRTVRNKSRDWARAMVDVSLSFEEDLERALDIVQAVADEYYADPERAEGVLEAPIVIGPLSMDASGYSIRVMIRTEVGKHWRAGRELRTSLHKAMLANHIATPRSVVEIWSNDHPGMEVNT